MASLAYNADFYRTLSESFRRLVGRPISHDQRDARWLYDDAPFAVLAHHGDDPQFIYANRSAQRCFEYGWDEIVGMRSSLSAEVSERSKRAALLAAVARDGYAADYEGIRVSKSGRRFWIEGGIIWNLVEADGIRAGQAALFTSWRDA
ncbi:MEKHLA domain-containing protein [Hansschlegelia sp. KR7-227]|uniref:MEKHLA domain-containing protein n=1 Tax=Hansschlegelia sp. KR7-227 TaxID=3400914 RepID=UPI003C10B207